MGSHVARALAEQGAELRLLVRTSSDPENIRGCKAERVVGDLRDPASLKKAMAGCDVVFHVAADYRLWVRDPRADVPLERRGHAGDFGGGAQQAGAPGGLYLERGDDGISTRTGHLASEDSPVSLADMIGPYKRSKFMAEEIAIEAGQGGNGRGGSESDDSGGRARHQAHADRTDRGRFSEEEVSRVRGYWVESGGCAGMCAGARGGAGEGKKRASATFWAARI